MSILYMSLYWKQWLNLFQPILLLYLLMHRHCFQD